MPTLTPTQQRLLEARKQYSLCANRLEGRIRSQAGFNSALAERISGIGVASEWLQRAGELLELTFVGRNLTRSKWAPSFVEINRFGFAWFAANAVFTRDSLLAVLGAPVSSSELERFRVLYNHVAAPQRDLAKREGDLHAILSTKTSPRLPGVVAGTTVTTLQAIDAKYIPASVKLKGNPKIISLAAASGNIQSLDLPMLIYAFRNWSVHGNVIHGSFGSLPRFRQYVDVLTRTLADVHVGTARTLLASL
jgi:hypothetical protein